MHIGGLRTALYSYLLAKKTGGQFILRIEDTDQKRLVLDAEERFCEDLQWAGLQWDEGPKVGGDYGPYRQSERNHIYQEYSKQIIESGAAYRCFCSSTSVDRGTNSFSVGGCYQNCSSLPADQAEERAKDGKQPFTVRLRQVSSNDLSYPDLIHGKVRRLKRTPMMQSQEGDNAGRDVSDTVLVKANGIPTYHFANVIDDHLMKITHVIRGTEWLSSLPLHYDLYRAFNWTPPLFAHVSLLTDKDGAKLSKRSQSSFTLDIKALREEERILPEALLNHLALLGWSHPGRGDLMSVSELIQNFDLKFTRGNVIVDPAKLWYLQKGHVHRRCNLAQETSSLEPILPIITDLETELLSLYSATDLHTRNQPLKDYIAEVLLINSKDFSTVQQFIERNSHFFYFDRAFVPEVQTTSLPLRGVSPAQILSDLFLSPPPPNLTTKLRPSPSVPSPQHSIEAAANAVYENLFFAIWLAILRSHSLPASSLDALELYTVQNAKDTSKIITTHIARLCATKGEQVDTKAMFNSYEQCVKVMMRVLREKLCYGLSGAGIGQVLAIVGWEEAARRLQIDVSNAKREGW